MYKERGVCIASAMSFGRGGWKVGAHCGHMRQVAEEGKASARNVLQYVSRDPHPPLVDLDISPESKPANLPIMLALLGGLSFAHDLCPPPSLNMKTARRKPTLKAPRDGQ